MAGTEQERLGRGQGFHGIWEEFLRRLRDLAGDLVQELEARQWDLVSLLREQAAKSAEFRKPQPTDLIAFRTDRAEAAAALLQEPATRWNNNNASRRALGALLSYERRLAHLAADMPLEASVNGPQLVSSLEDFIRGGLRQRWLSIRRKARVLPLRHIAEATLSNSSRPRLELEGRFLAALVEAARLPVESWESARVALDSAELGGIASGANDANPPEWLQDPSSWLARLSHGPMEEIRLLPQTLAEKTANRIIGSFLWHSSKSKSETRGRIDALDAGWTAQVSAADDELQLELLLERFEDRFLALLEETFRSLEAERARLFSELDRAIDWLRRRQSSRPNGSFPEPQCKVVAASLRITELESALMTEVNTLPVGSEARSHFSALPSRPVKPRQLHVGASYLQAFQRAARPLILEALQSVESGHIRILQGLERAREVVAFGVASSASGTSPELASEAIQNAVKLLEYYRLEQTAWREPADRLLARAAATFFIEGRLVLKRRRLGVLVYLARRGFRRAGPEIARSAGRACVKAVRRLLELLNRLFSAFLIYIGWKVAPGLGRAEVVTRPVMPEEFVFDLARKELPPLYRHLFRFEPIEDPRFLVGREREMKAISEARLFWEGGRPAAVIIVGQRGSGKTSLINCASKACLAGLEVNRGEFGERLVNESQLRDFLAGFMKVEKPDQLEACLLQRRRVVILEELERTFLRQVGYFGAIRALLRIIAATCPSTLWILATNQVSFRFLSAAVQLGQSFSHQINAGNAARQDLRNAILIRHNLSGLRLRFLPPPEQEGSVESVLGRVRNRKNPEEIFFDALAAESDGVYRSAFDIWLGQIDTIQAGELSVKPLVHPQLSPVIDALSTDDLFTLVAILQHGGLTPEEHRVIFHKSGPSSRAQLDGLLAREIIEPEPARPGFRIRPQAMRVVREALYRRNLL